MINLTKYAEEQRELDAVLKTVPTNEQLVTAILAELGEVANSRKYKGWCWWPRPGKQPATRNEVLGELIDVFHFLLVGYNTFGGENQIDFNALPSSRVLKLKTTEEGIALYSCRIINSAFNYEYEHGLSYWYDLTVALGFDENDIRRGFDRSVDKNRMRWAK